ncbi:hypothetical protein AciM339_0024 [Aciduliprofundum sp. MAR08-339]|uniref:hypothetical protein n=1 Tax=Aciduliprofundum sp. (strain MAR08-339) TaxID=673860 RepID=UPI0002A4C203|nr:hypothetical protein AciM339_0024 [Aciduliprofundum sp. MAR08-339]
MGLLNELEEIKRQERASKKNLQKLKKNFYEDTINRIEELRMNARVYMEKMDLEKAGKIMGEIKKIEKALDEIIALRTRKILLSTLWKNEREVKNLTKEEEVLYREVKDAIERHKNAIYRREVSPLQEKKEKERKVEEIEKEEYVLARVKVPSMKIALPDRNLILKKEDVLHMPKKIFSILSKNDAVEEIKL